jgi:hypothetical protein
MWKRLARRHDDKALAQASEQRMAADEQRDGAMLGEAGESRFKLAFAANAQDKNLPPE